MVAVTDALLVPFDVDYWCFQEGPGGWNTGRCKAYRPHLLEKTPQMWVWKGQGWRFESKWKLEGTGVTVEDSEDVMDMTEWTYLEPVFFKEQPTIDPRSRLSEPHGVRDFIREHMYDSFFYALVRCITRLGATEVDIYGADMQGHSNFDPGTGEVIENAHTLPDSQPLEDGWWEHRWNTVRECFDRVQEACSKQGVNIRRLGCVEPTSTATSTSG